MATKEMANPGASAHCRRHITACLVLWLGAELVARADAYTDSSGTFYYSNSNGAITITNYTGSVGSVAIPAAINGLPVTAIGDWAFHFTSLTNLTIPGTIASIGDYAFDSCFGLRGVTIPNSVTNLGFGAFRYEFSMTNLTIGNSVPSIAPWAFYECEALSSITVPDNVSSIGDTAFSACGNLTIVTIGKGVTNIGPSVFEYCASLTSISVDALNPSYSSEDGVLFDKARATLISYPSGKGGIYAIPEGVTNIAPEAFTACSSVTTVTLPASLAKIGTAAFEGFLLDYVVIPNTVTSIGSNAFQACFIMTNATIGTGVTIIADYGFSECTNLHTVYFKGNAPTIGNQIFWSHVYPTIVYYLPGTTGWGPVFGDLPAVLWNPLAQTRDSSFGVQHNRFGFSITGTTNIPLVIEASTNAAAGPWTSLQSCGLTNGAIYFSDSNWTNYPNRFYRIRSP